MADGLMNNPFLGLLNMGLSPEQAQAQIDEQRAMQFANMNPQQRAAAGIYQGITGIGRALGAKDPMLEQASQIRALQQQFDTQTAEGMAGFARALKDINPALAAQASEMARKIQKQEEEIKSTQALTKSRLRENDPRELFIRANADKYTPASIQTFSSSGNYSDLKEITKEAKDIAPSADFVAVAGELGFGVKNKIGDYSPEQLKAINQTLFQRAKEKAPRTQVSVDTKGPSAFVEELGKEDAKRVVEARRARDAATSELKTLEKAVELSNKPLVTGTAQAQRLSILNFLDTAVGLGGKTKQELVNSQQFDKITGDLVLDKIKKLGANPSNADREFIARIVPNLTISPEARSELLKYLQKRAQDVVAETTALEQYAVKNRGLTGYRTSTPVNWGDLPK